MTIDTPCPQCGTVFTVRRELVGKRTKCIRCGAAFTIAEMPTAAAPPRPNVASAADAPAQPAVNYFPEIEPPPEIAPAPRVTAEPTRRTAPQPASTREFFGFEPDASQPRFPALKMVARAYEILAIVVLAFAAVMMVIFLVAVIGNPAAILAAIFGSGLVFFWSLVVAISLLATAQVIRLALQIEKNTREAQLACRQLADHLTAIETEP
jgi:hypothetical protein